MKVSLEKNNLTQFPWILFASVAPVLTHLSLSDNHIRYLELYNLEEINRLIANNNNPSSEAKKSKRRSSKVAATHVISAPVLVSQSNNNNNTGPRRASNVDLLKGVSINNNNNSNLNASGSIATKIVVFPTLNTLDICRNEIDSIEESFFLQFEGLIQLYLQGMLIFRSVNVFHYISLSI